MKHYILKLVTQHHGPVTLVYSDNKDLAEFIEEVKNDHGEFIQLSIDEFEHPIIDQVIELEPGEAIDIKPFIVTYTVYKNPYPPYDKLEIDTTADGWKKGKCTLYEFMLAIRSGTFKSIDFK